MTPITPEDIEGMRTKGYGPETIRKAEKRLELLQLGEKVAAQIRQAFAGVTLGSGIGLQEAQAIDDYAGEETRASYREGDEKDDWQKIDPADLNRCNSSPCFFDAEGMRFHLPAFLIADLRGAYGFGMAYCLTHLSDYTIRQFSKLTRPQRAAVAAYLLHILHDPDYEHDRPMIRQALDEYWLPH